MLRCLAAFVLVAAIVAMPLGPRPALGGQDDPRLEALFADLRATDDSAEGARLGREIAAIWLHSGDAAIDMLMFQGRQFLEAGELIFASERFRRITILAPDFAEGWNKRAHVRYLMGDFPASIDHIQRALALEPRHFLALAGLGLVYARTGQDRSALEAFERALEINPHLIGVRRMVDDLKGKLEGERT